MDKEQQIHSKNKVRALIFIMAIMIFFGAILTIIMLFNSCDDNQNIYVKIGETDVLKLQPIRLKGMFPGSKEEYTLNITSDLSGAYKLKFAFEELKNEGLREFIDVEMIFDGVMLYQGTLDELLDGRVIPIETNLDERKPIKIRVVYKMPKTVGNAAQGTALDFDILINAEIQ